MSDLVTVLVVEDEPLILLDIVQHLRDSGFIVLEATNAADAIDLLAANSSIRLIFTDVDMPGSMDGLKLAAAVRDRWPPVKIIVTSGARPIANSEMPDGSVFLGKPYSYMTVLSSMREMLSA